MLRKVFQGNGLGDEVRWRAGGEVAVVSLVTAEAHAVWHLQLVWMGCLIMSLAKLIELHTHTHTHRSLSLPLSFCPYSPPFSFPRVLISDVNAELLECHSNCHVRTLKFTGTRSEMWGCKIQLRCALIIDSLMQAESSRTSRQDINNMEGKEKEVTELVVLF